VKQELEKSTMLSDKAQGEIKEIIKRYPMKRSAILPALWVAQRECGYLSEEAMRSVARLLEINPTQVYEVATFYTMYSLEPTGKYVIQVCRTLSCALCGALEILRTIQQKLGIKEGETTRDGLFTLKTVECIASCGTAPAIQINEQYYENLTTEKVDRILSDLAGTGKSSLASGPFMCPKL
jgi:NADH-quinone oxidoreductase E subunit